MKLGINATRIGGHACRYLAADMREDRIASTFRHGVNVVFEEEVAPTYISIQTPEAPLHPWAIEVPAIPPGIDVGATLHVAGTPPSASARRTPDIVQELHPPSSEAPCSLATPELLDNEARRVATNSEPRTPNPSLTLNLRHATCHELLLEVYTPEEAKRALTRLSVVRSQLDRCSRHASDPFQPQIRGTLRAWQASDDPATLIELVGLGSGSTPAGDDVLVGVLAGLTAVSDVSAAARLSLAALRLAVTEVRLRTHPASWQMLAAAGDGSFPEPLLDLARGIASVGPAAELSAVAARVLALGATSGRSFLLGLVAGLQRAGSKASGRRRREIRKRSEPHSLKRVTPA